MRLYLNALGVVNALGTGKRQIAHNLFQGSRAGLIHRDDLLPDRPVRVGAIPSDLPHLPDRLALQDSRNNRLALSALCEIESDIMKLGDTVGPHRIAVVMGTSTSGIASGEKALAHRIAKGSWQQTFA